ncbi:TPA: serine/threonine protein kinase [Candidatus Poribacteria bacterium]|nr:serine/threonine protein kinase [Candidatus Poribacteria bacterium]
MRYLFTFGILVTMIIGLQAEETTNWPQFRGPGARGVAKGKGLPTTWSTTENVKWCVPVPGRGWSSPVIWGDKVFLSSAISTGKEKTVKKGLYFGGNEKTPSPNQHRWMIYCFSFESGEKLWEQEANVGKPLTPRHIKNNYAPETQVTDGNLIYTYFADQGLFAHDLDGELKWKRKMKAYKTRYNWGSAASPALHGDFIYILNDNEQNSFIEAIDKNTGETLWRRDRNEKSNWSTPFVWENSLRTEIITIGTGKTRSYGLDGTLLWKLVADMSSITIATPFTAHGLLYVTSGYVGDKHKPIYAIQPGGKGTINLKKNRPVDKSIVWRQPNAAPYNPSTLVYKDLLYVLYDFGFLACFNAKTGEKIYDKVRVRKRQRTPFTASPWAYNDKVFCLSEDGDCFVYKAGRKNELLHINKLDELCMATPGIARGNLFIRTASKLYRISK